MFNIQTLAAEGAGGNSWIMLVVIGVLLVFMVLMSVIPQKKRQKKTQQMMAALSKGDKIKTIGGFVGTIHAIDDATNTLVIDLGDSTPVYVTIDKSAVYTVLNANPAAATAQQADVAAPVAAETVKSIDDQEAEAKKAEKAKKSNKKAAKDVEAVAVDVPAEEISADNATDAQEK